MTRFYRPLFWLTLFLFVGSTAQDLQAQLPAGKEFLVSVPAFWRQVDLGEPGQIQITIMASRQTDVTIRWSGPNGGILDQGTIAAGNRLTIQSGFFALVNLMQPFYDKVKQEVNQRTLYVEADRPVSVMAIYEDYRQGSSFMASWAVAPLESYDTAYMGVTYMGSRGKNSGYMITAAEDGTEVTFDPRIQWDSPSESIPVPVTLTMKKHQVFMIPSFGRGGGSSGDLSGTPITSNKPIGVMPFAFQSNVDMELPADTSNDYQYNWRLSGLAAVLPSEKFGGTLFYTAPMGPQDTSIVRVMALEDGTNVSFNSIGVGTLNRGEWTTERIGRGTRINADKPVMALQLSRSGNNPIRDTVIRINGDPDDTVRIPYVFGNPSMAWLPPVSQFKPTLQWTNPRPPNRRTPIPGRDSILVWPWYHYALVTAPVGVAPSVRIDGAPVDFQYDHIDGAYVSAVVPMLPRQHELLADGPVSCIAYGYGYNEAYALVSSEALRSIARVDVDTVRLTTCDSIGEVRFNLSNFGNNEFQIDSVGADGIEIRSSRRPNAFPTFMPPGRELEVHLVLSLPQTREYSGSFFLYTDANNVQRVEIPFKVVRDSASFEVVPNVDFGLVPNEVATKDTSIVLKNTGAFPVTITTLDFDSPQFEIVSPGVPRTIPPSGSITIKVRITPRPGFPESGKLQIIGEPCMAPITIPYTGFKGAGPLLGVERVLKFDDVLCETPGPRDTAIILRSSGDEPIELTNATITGPDRALFTIQDNPAPTTILPGEVDTVVVRYTPVGYGRHQASLDLKTNAANAPDPLTIALSGRVDTATAEPNRRTIDFGTILSCDPAPILELKLTNGGTIDAMVTSAKVDEEDVPFAVTSANQFTIPPAGIERLVSVQFSPDREGDFTGTLRITGDPCGIDEVIVLRGKRIDPKLEVVESSVDFGSILYCAEDGTATLTLRNSGQVADTIRRVTPSGSDRFTLVDPTFPFIVEPGATRELEVQFDPESPGTFTGELEFFWGPCDLSTVATLQANVLEASIGLSGTAVDFGSVDVDAPEATGTVTVTNTGDVPRDLSLLLGGLPPDVRIVSPLGSSTVQPGETLDVVLGFNPADTVTLSGELYITATDPCGSIDTVTVTGIGTGEIEITSDLVLTIPDDLTGKVDEIVAIPIQISPTSTLVAGAVTSLTMVLKHNATILYPLSLTALSPGITGSIVRSEIVGSNREVTLQFDGATFLPGTRLGQLDARVLLGEVKETPLEIDGPTPVVAPGNIVNVSTINGKFTALGVCELDGDRLITVGVGLRVLPPRPAPATDVTQVPFIVDGEGWHTLAIYDAAGNLKMTIPLGLLQNGGYSTTLDLSDIPAGYYLIEIDNGRERVSVPILVRK